MQAAFTGPIILFAAYKMHIMIYGSSGCYGNQLAITLTRGAMQYLL